jgi:HlyD family secretion protein
LTEFRPEAEVLENRAPPFPSRLVLYAAAALVLAAIAWASLAEIDEIVVARGRVVPTAPDLVLQPLEASVVRSIDVQVGDVVKTGDPLVTLDPTFAQADVAQYRSRLAAKAAEVDRLEAELGDGPYQPTGATAEASLQARLYVQRQSYLRAQLGSLDEQIAATQAEMATAQADIAGLAAQLETGRDIETLRGTLMASQFGSKLNYLEARFSRLGTEQSLGHMRGQLAELTHTLADARTKREAVIEEFRRGAMDDLVKARAERDAAAEELRKVDLRRSMVVLRAPADSVVLEIAPRSIGSVVREAEPLVTLVPVDVPLEVEASIGAGDMAPVTQGRPVRIKIDALPFQRHGVAEGVIRTVSPDAFAVDGKPGDTAGGAFYRLRIRLTDVRLRNLPQHFRLLPGMTVRAEIEAGRRTVLSYFLYPLLRGLDESIREP